MQRLTPGQTRAVLKRIGIEQTRAATFAYEDTRHQLRYDFHTHSRHQLLYAYSGIIHLETRTGFWMLPPQRAAWIPAGTRHATTLNRVRAHSLYFSPRQFPGLGSEIRVLAVTPLLREMIHYAMQWQTPPAPADRFRRQFFAVLAELLRRQARPDAMFRLPRARSAGLQAAITALLADLAAGQLAQAAAHARLSDRTFRRRFHEEMNLNWSDFVHQARMLQAMDWLTTDRNVTEVALAVGFHSLSAFAKAFRKFTGESPLEYKQQSRLAGSRTVDSTVR